MAGHANNENDPRFDFETIRMTGVLSAPVFLYFLTDAKIPVINRSFPLPPAYATEHAAGLDLRANLSKEPVIGSLETTTSSYRNVHRFTGRL